VDTINAGLSELEISRAPLALALFDLDQRRRRAGVEPICVDAFAGAVSDCGR
jgi:hypothetical protein